LLLLQASASRTHTALSIIHSLLERVVFPAKDVVAVLAVTCVVAGAEVEWLRAVGGPVGLIVELAGVPDDLSTISNDFWISTKGSIYLEHDLGDGDGVGRRALSGDAGALERCRALDWVCDV
jgi:hypothetical protein